VQPGERVLILGAGGGVGTCCVQLAKAAGAEVIACASGEWKLERLRALGADHLIDSATGDWVEAVRGRFGRPRVAGGGGVDVIVNYVGGESWNASLKVLGRGGRLLVCGASAGHRVETDLRYLWSFEHTIVGSDGWTPDDQARLLAMVAERRLEPIIHAVRPFSAAAEAVRELIERRVFGKSVLVPEDGEASGGAGGLPDA
jgi:alcohol dehydrogenase